MKERSKLLKYSAVIVDDERIVRDGLKKHFDWKKYSIEIKGCFEDGAQAWGYLEDHETDILITDVRMVHMDGIELARRTVEKYPNTSVLFISGYGDIDHLKDALKLGAVDYILKSIDLDELAAAIERTTERIQKRKRHEAIIRTPGYGAGYDKEADEPKAHIVQDSAAVYKVKDSIERTVLKGKLPTTQNKCSALEFLFLFLDLGVVIHNPWLQIPPLFFFCG